MPHWRLFYHIVWSTSNREPLIRVDFEADLHNVMAAKASELGAFVHAVGGTESHVHLVASVPPRIAISDLVGQVKGSSSHWVNNALALPDHFNWQAEYGVVSFGGKQLDTIVKYVHNQRRHHVDGSPIPFLEREESR